MVKNDLINSLNKIEDYFCNTSYKIENDEKNIGRIRRILRWAISFRGGLCLFFAISVVFGVGLFAYAKFVIKTEISLDLKTAFLLLVVILMAGYVAYFVIFDILILIETFGAQLLLRRGFSYLKMDSVDLIDLEAYLSRRPLEELDWIKVLLKQSPPYSIYAEPIKNSFGFVFSLSIVGVIIGFILNSGGDNSILKKLEPIISNDMFNIFLLAETIFLTLLLIVAYYKWSYQIYEQKNNRVIAILELLIEKKKSEAKNDAVQESSTLPTKSVNNPVDKIWIAAKSAFTSRGKPRLPKI